MGIQEKLVALVIVLMLTSALTVGVIKLKQYLKKRAQQKATATVQIVGEVFDKNTLNNIAKWVLAFGVVCLVIHILKRRK